MLWWIVIIIVDLIVCWILILFLVCHKLIFWQCIYEYEMGFLVIKFVVECLYIEHNDHLYFQLCWSNLLLLCVLVWMKQIFHLLVHFLWGMLVVSLFFHHNTIHELDLLVDIHIWMQIIMDPFYLDFHSCLLIELCFYFDVAIVWLTWLNVVEIRFVDIHLFLDFKSIFYFDCKLFFCDH